MRRFITILLSALCLTVACKRDLKPVEVEITDPNRHYYPVIQGELLGVTYDIENTSDSPLFIQEIQTTCGCIIPLDDLPIVILPNQTGQVRLKYNSTKNTGFVEHTAWLYGNFADSTYRELRFDTNVVPPVTHTPDYEELYRDVITRSPDMKDLIDGKASDRGYYTDEGIDPRLLQQPNTEEE